MEQLVAQRLDLLLADVEHVAEEGQALALALARFGGRWRLQLSFL
ncbi:MAG TPA: hypothetical protein VNJ46_09740 [Gaiellaceae bacterium]|nr:hypothetical protein [Gaiellaceae bacterium]